MGKQILSELEENNIDAEGFTLTGSPDVGEACLFVPGKDESYPVWFDTAKVDGDEITLLKEGEEVLQPSADKIPDQIVEVLEEI